MLVRFQSLTEFAQIVLGGPLAAPGMHFVWHKQGCGISYRASKVEVVNSSKMDSFAFS